MTTSTRLSRLKAWMLEAYSSAPIGNRLKGEAQKLVIADPHFTFHGLTVLSTWSQDVDVATMADGWCQRMNYYVAPARTDTTMFDHFIYFEGADVSAREAELREAWQALCAQPGAIERYSLQPRALAFLNDWWKSLEATWGDFVLPASFLRRIGFSVLRYLVVLQFLLGKSRHPIDIETASIATAYAEYHMESALLLIQSCDQAAARHLQRVAELWREMKADDRVPTVRDISRRLGKAAREMIDGDLVKEIVALLEQGEKGGPAGFPVEIDPKTKSATILEDWQHWRKRAARNEKARNQRRLRNLLRARQTPTYPAANPEMPHNVIGFHASAWHKAQRGRVDVRDECRSNA